MTVNKENMRLWVEALRSGEYTQTKGLLYRSEDGFDNDGNVVPVGYCCLGVACEVAIKNGFAFLHNDGEEEEDQFWWKDNSTGELPLQVSDWLGLDPYRHEDPVLTDDPIVRTRPDGEQYALHDHTSAAHANDTLGWDFAKIADALEAKYLTTTTPVEVNN